jgi:DNA replicative helicase MCM subunit Mcm2 (Cdc46/Mcm family)
MAHAEGQELIERFQQFYRRYYSDEVAELARGYPQDRKSLYVDYRDVERFDTDLADDYLERPGQLREHAEEALRTYDLPVDVQLGQAHVRVRNLRRRTEIRAIRSDHVNRLVAVQGIVRKATDVRPKVQEAAFECQRCGTLTFIPQSGGFQEPHECQGCERQGPFEVNVNESKFVDAQQLRVQESPEGLRGGETPQSIDVHIEDDITGEVTPGDHVTATGVLRLDQRESNNEQSAMFDVYMEGESVVIEDEEFEDMDITDEDKADIVELSESEDIYERIVASIAPSIYGHEEAKLAMALQLFSGVTKQLPDGSRTRGDLHVLLIGDPGTGKCLKGDERVTLADGRERPLRELVEDNLDDPVPVDDGVYDTVDIKLPSMFEDGSVGLSRATKVWKRSAPERMYRVRTASGKELEVTPSHPLFVQSGGVQTRKRAKELAEGEFLAVPSTLPTRGDDTLDVDYRRSDANNAVRLDLPKTWTCRLARLVGFIIAEGHVRLRDDNTGDVRVTNDDEEIVTDTIEAFEALGLNCTVDEPHEGKSAVTVRCDSGEFVSFLNQLEPRILGRSAEQRVPDALLCATPETKRAFLRAYVDAEGHVSATQRSVTVSSTSRELLEGVRSLLLALDIPATVEPRNNGSYRLRISGEAFVRYADRVGFVTERKAAASRAFDGCPQNTNVDVVPDIGAQLRRVRERLELAQADCGLPRATYQHYERGNRNPSIDSLETVVDAFEERTRWLRDAKSRIEAGDWSDIETVREELNVSQRALADGMGVTQTAVSYYERESAVPDGGRVAGARDVVLDRIQNALAVAPDVERLRTLVENDLAWERIDAIETVDPDYDWVYDLEVEDTHNYLTNNVVSHNSQLLQYVRNIAPRSVYTSGKGSSSAGLCVTGDTMVHTAEGFVPIREMATEYHPDPVSEETAAEATRELYTYDREAGSVELSESSHVWRMPEKECRRVETAHGKQLEASTNTPLLVCGEYGLEWREITAVEPGDRVAVPDYDGIERDSPPVREFLELTNEKVKPTPDSVEFLRTRLREEFGTLRDAAAELDLSEDVVYDSLSNRHLPLEKLDRLLDAVGADLREIDIERVMLRHGDGVRIPDEFDAELLYLIGLVFGDGDVAVSRRGENRGHVRISNSDEELLQTAAGVFERTFGKSPEIEYQDDRVPCIRVHSATVARFFSNLGVESPKEDVSLDPRLTTAEHADAFLRGLLDADGSVCPRDDGGSSVQYSTTCDDLARQVQLMLESYGIRARTRERDRRGTYELESGYEIESTSVQTHLAIYGRNVDRFAEEIGFDSETKSSSLSTIVGDAPRRGEQLPVGDALLRTDGAGGAFYQNLERGDDPSRSRARDLLANRDLGDVAPAVEEVVDADLVWDEVVAAEDTGKKEVFDLTVPETRNFLGNGVVTHNTAAAVRDDFGDGQQWTLEAGALVLADRGIAAVDELDKMRPEDQSAMHEALEQQSISISKAGINATLKSRCSLLGAANPTYGRFDPYEPIGEQIDLDPPLISRFDLIFTVTDQPDEEEDRRLAQHILQTNYAGELNTHREEMARSNVAEEAVEEAVDEVAPDIDAEFLRKYIAYSRRNCFPTMTEEAKAQIEEFYVDLRAEGQEEDAPVPITARKLEALVRLAEASARVRLSDSVTAGDAERVIDIVQSQLNDIGIDPETGDLDADIVETGTSKTQRDRIRGIKDIIADLQDEYEEGAPLEEVLDEAEAEGMERSKAEREIDKLKEQGEIYQPNKDHLRTL